MSDSPDTYREKLRSLGFRKGPRTPKTTTDVHDHHSVDVTEHWDDRVDVTVRPDPIRVRMTQES
jgi:hypothetical protein